jgi:hypothetical protein
LDSDQIIIIEDEYEEDEDEYKDSEREKYTIQTEELNEDMGWEPHRGTDHPKRSNTCRITSIP